MVLTPQSPAAALMALPVWGWYFYSFALVGFLFSAEVATVCKSEYLSVTLIPESQKGTLSHSIFFIAGAIELIGIIS